MVGRFLSFFGAYRFEEVRVSRSSGVLKSFSEGGGLRNRTSGLGGYGRGFPKRKPSSFGKVDPF